MANICYQQLKFKGENGELKKLSDAVIDSLGGETNSGSYEHTWIGNIIKKYLPEDFDFDRDLSKISCAGWIDYISPIDDDDSVLEIECETKWTPFFHVWDLLIKKLELKTIKSAYLAEEFGGDIFVIYDEWGAYTEIYGDHTVRIDSYGSPELDEMSDIYTEKDAIGILQKFFNTEESDLTKLREMCEDFNDKNFDAADELGQSAKLDEFIMVYPFEYIEDPFTFETIYEKAEKVVENN